MKLIKNLNKKILIIRKFYKKMNILMRVNQNKLVNQKKKSKINNDKKMNYKNN